MYEQPNSYEGPNILKTAVLSNQYDMIRLLLMAGMYTASHSQPLLDPL
jgi:hypothetical protein